MSTTAAPAQPLAAAPALPAPTRRAIAAITIGNGLEFYDFTVYSFFAVMSSMWCRRWCC